MGRIAAFLRDIVRLLTLEMVLNNAGSKKRSNARVQENTSLTPIGENLSR
jgi:hypothetical protein